jgi:hypothetical protein
LKVIKADGKSGLFKIQRAKRGYFFHLFFIKKNHHGFSATSPAMKMKGRAADSCGTKEKRGKNEERILM